MGSGVSFAFEAEDEMATEIQHDLYSRGHHLHTAHLPRKPVPNMSTESKKKSKKMLRNLSGKPHFC